VKVAKKIVERKTPGALIVEKYRPRMNKLTTSERQQLRDRAMRIAFSHESEPPLGGFLGMIRKPCEFFGNCGRNQQ